MSEERYEIRIEEPGEVAKSYGMDYPMHVVWDKELGKAIPFGRHRNPDRAQAHLLRQRARGTT